MELISTFEKDGTTFVTDENGNTYELKLVKKVTPSNTHKKKYDDPQLKNKIIDMLQNLQAPTNYSGYKLLIDCLYFSIKFEECRENVLETLYPKVALLHNIKSTSVPGLLDSLIYHWCRAKEYKELFGKKRVMPKKLILRLTDYFLNQN